MLKQILCKKTYMMNVVLFITSIILFVLLMNMYDGYPKYGLLMFCCALSFFSLITFKENDVESFWNVSLLINLTLLLGGFIILSLLIYKDPSNHFDIRLNRHKYMYLIGFLWVVSGINLKSLFQLKITEDYLKNIPYWCLGTVLLISLFFQIQPYVPEVSRHIREIYSFLLVVLMVFKFTKRIKVYFA